MFRVTTTAGESTDYSDGYSWEDVDVNAPGSLVIYDDIREKVALYAPGAWASVIIFPPTDEPAEAGLYPPERLAAIVQVLYPEAPSALMPASMRRRMQAVYDAAIGRR